MDSTDVQASMEHVFWKSKQRKHHGGRRFNAPHDTGTSTKRMCSPGRCSGAWPTHRKIIDNKGVIAVKSFPRKKTTTSVAMSSSNQHRASTTSAASSDTLASRQQ
ncbi:hypothetical protein Dsin_016280 [Dipteronia sinensis]|uniref:Uncharacterized protein n=1 Tax=Dipteronia sinensis TaxID=43782 RepID=A0AAE0AD22_9ROSI|nr:hypothetical protein Dsin_016280 [Dipteronia sinensis]